MNSFMKKNKYFYKKIHSTHNFTFDSTTGQTYNAVVISNYLYLNNMTNDSADTRPAAVLLMGIPAAGKTTFYKQVLAGQGAVHINLDTLRTRHREMQLIHDCLSSRRSFVVDNTNTLPGERARYISLAAQAGYRVVGYFLRSRVQECIQSNAGRDKQVPIAAITAMSARLILPSLAEGFDELFFVSRSVNGFDISPWKE